MKCSVIALLLWTCLVGCSEHRSERSPAPTSTPHLTRVPAPKSSPDPAAAQAVIEAVKADTTGTTPDWSGEYYTGDGTGVNITFALSPKAGAAYTWHGCLGCYGTGVGSVREEDGWVLVSFTTQDGIAPRWNGRFWPVKWGDRRFLVDESELAEFCDEVNLVDDPTQWFGGVSCVRAGDERKSVYGSPHLPAGWGARLFKEPVNARVTAVKELGRGQEGQWERRSYDVTIDRGSRAGLRLGTPLVPVKPRGFFEFRITAITDDTAVVRYSWESWNGSELSTPARDWVFSTRRAALVTDRGE